METFDFNVIRADNITVASGYKCDKCGVTQNGMVVCMVCGYQKPQPKKWYERMFSLFD